MSVTEARATWTTAYVNDLPDTAFLYVEAGGSKDSEGKTTPRSLRHFPYKDASGAVDLPHLRNALARIPQSSLPQSVKDSATAKAKRLLASQEGQSSRPPRDELVRADANGLELRDAGHDAPPTMVGHFATFDEWTEIDSVFEGNFLERVAPGAFKKTFDESGPRMRVLFQHGQDPQVGDKPLGAIDVLEEDERGAYYEVPLLDAPYVRDNILPGLRAGLYGSSFRFAVQREEFNRNAKASEYNPKGLPERTLKEVAVREFGPVTFPAYAGTTAGVRSLTDEFLKQKLSSVELQTRMDVEDLSCLAEMIVLGGQYIEEQDEPGDEANIPVMRAVLAQLAGLVPYEAQEDEGAEVEDEMASAGRNAEKAPPGTDAALPGTSVRDAAIAANPKTWPPVPPDVWEELWNPGI